jgi:hypothetical protein
LLFAAINDMLLDMLAAVARKDFEDRRRRQVHGQAKAVVFLLSAIVENDYSVVGSRRRDGCHPAFELRLTKMEVVYASYRSGLSSPAWIE